MNVLPAHDGLSAGAIGALIAERERPGRSDRALHVAKANGRPHALGQRSMKALSPRLRAIVDTLPLVPGLRVLEVGCGPGALARAMAARVAPGGHVLGLDRSARAIAQAIAVSAAVMASGTLSFRQGAIEEFALAAHDAPFDLIVAVRVGALDGRHPTAGARAWPRVQAALAPGGRVFVDGVERGLRRPRSMRRRGGVR